MSQRPAHSIAILEVSGAALQALDPATGKVHRGTDFGAVLGALGHKEVVLAFSRRSAFVRAVRMPEASRVEIAQILAMQIGQYFPIPASELAYDFRITPDKNAEGRLVIVGAVRNDLLRKTTAELKAAGVQARFAIPTSFGSWALATALGVPNCAVIEETSEGLAIDIVIDGELRYSRVAPSVRSQAEIDAEVARTFSVAGVPTVPVVAAGGMAYGGAQFQTDRSTLEALGEPIVAQVGMSIEPPEARAERIRAKQRQKARLVAMFAVGAATLFTLAYLDYLRGARDVDVAKRRNQSSLTAARKEADKHQAVAARHEGIKTRLKLAFNPAQRFSDILRVASNSTPSDTWLTGVTAQRGRPITLRGTAISNESVAAYLNRLSGDPRFRDVNLQGATNALIEDTPVVQFSLEAHAIGNLPLDEEKRGRTARR